MTVGFPVRIDESRDSDVCDSDNITNIINILRSRSELSPQTRKLSFVSDGIEDTAASWSWRDLDERAQEIAHVLAETEQVQSGDRVLLVFSSGLDFIAALFGCFYLKAIPVPVPPPRRREKLSRFAHILQDSQASGILTTARFMSQLKPVADQHAAAFCLSVEDTGTAEGRPQIARREVPQLTSHDIAFLQYTSGSTSAPKGVMVSHGNLMANLAQIADVFQATPDDHMMSWLPHYHDMGLIGTVLFPLYSGFSITFMTPAAFLRNPMRFLELASEIRATGFGSPNFGFDHCVRHARPEALEKLDLSALRIAFSGAEMIRPNTMEAFQEVFGPAGLRSEALMTCYGMAETVLLIAGGDPKQPPRFLTLDRAQMREGHASLATSGIRIASCGIPAPKMELAIVDPDTQHPLADNRIGEIWVRGENVTAGYWNNATATAAVFDQLLSKLGGWFRTGDLGFVHDGELYVTGRLKEAIIIRGQNHAPQDIESTVVQAHEVLTEARVAAFAVQTQTQEQLALVIEVPRDVYRRIETVSEQLFAAIRPAITQRHGLQAEQITLIRPNSLPVTSSGKVQRFACRDALQDGTLQTLAEWRHTTTSEADTPEWRSDLDATQPIRRHEILTSRMQIVLSNLAGLSGDQAVSEQTRLFDLGLDSVAGIEFVSTLEQQLGLTLDPTVIYEFPTLAALTPWLLERLYPTALSNAKAPEPSTELADEMAALTALLTA